METKTISRKKLIGILLAFVLTAGTILATAVIVSAVGLDVIDEVAVALHYPELGASHCGTDGVSAMVVPLDQGHYTIKRAYWYNGGTMDTNEGCGLAPGSFVAGKPYFAEFDLVPENGYTFSDDTKVTINGAAIRMIAVRNGGATIHVATKDITATQDFETKGSDTFPVRVVISTFDKEGHGGAERGGTAVADKTVVKFGDTINVDVSPYYGYGILNIDFGSGATGGYKQGVERSAMVTSEFDRGNAGGYFQIDVTFKETETENLTLIRKSFDWTTKKWILEWNAITGADHYEVRIRKMAENEFKTVATIDWNGTMEYCLWYANSYLTSLDEYEVRVVAIQDKAFGQVDELAVSNSVFIYQMGRIRFDLNGGDSGKPQDITGKVGNIVMVPSTIPVRVGYNFMGWGTKATTATTTRLYHSGDGVTLSGDTVLYAIWEDAGVGPKIVKQPSDATAEVGSTAKFVVVATGTAPLSYQWQSRKDSSGTWANSSQPGAKTATLNVTTTPGLHGWQFRCVVTDGNGKPKASDYATLTVKPAFTKQPANTTVTVGSTAKFTVTVSGKGPMKYQWQSRKDSSSTWANSSQPGAKTATLNVTTTPGLHGWQFRCVVTDGNGIPNTSNPATLTVKPKITTQPKNTTVTVGSTAKFTIVATGKATLKYQWQSRKDSSSTWTNSSQPGAKTATLNVTTTAGLHGWQFRCIVTDGNGQPTESNPATLTVKPAITKQPANTSVTAGSTAKFTVTATGKAPLKYQWQSRKDSSSTWANSSQPGAKTATLNVSATKGLNGWQFRCIVTDANGQPTESNPATLTVK